MKTLITAFASLVIATSASAAMAQEHGGFGHHDALPGFHLLLKTANLTAAQKSQVHQLMKSNWAQKQALHQQMRALHEQIADKLASPGPVNASDLTAIQQQIAQLRGQMDQQSVQLAMQVRGLLTSDQLRQASQAHEQIKSLQAQLKAVLPEEPMSPERFDGPIERP